MNVTFVELSNSQEDLLSLGEFYNQVYTTNFIDPDERVSLDDIEGFLKKKSDGWYKQNNYHVIIAKHEEKIIAGSISDYFADCSAAAIEFITVSQEYRGNKVGRLLLEKTIEVLNEDGELDLVVAEIENPEIYKGASVIPPLDRALIWKKYGFSRVDFNYIQPRLSENQQPISFLWLIAKQKKSETKITSSLLLEVLRCYFELAMGIEDAKLTEEYISVEKQLAGKEFVGLVDII